jgi:hypothetical protein
MNAYGLVIAVVMHFWSELPRTFCEAGLAQSLRRRWSRLGPIVPVAPAAASVWQPLHPEAPVKMALPAAGLVVAEAELDVETFPSDDGGDPGGAPGSPDSAATGAGVPTGGGPFGFCELSHWWYAAGVTTCTGARMNECPAPQSSVHSAG